MQKIRKKKNQKRKQVEKVNENEEAKSNLHMIDQMQTFYIKNWETEEHAEQQKVNPEVSTQLHKKKIAQHLSESLSKQPAYSSSLPRLKPLVFSHSKLKLIWKPKEPSSQRLLPQLKSQPYQSHSLKLQSQQKKTIFSSRIIFQHILPFQQNNKIQQRSSTSREVEQRAQKKLLYPRNRTQTDSKLEMKFKEFKIDPKHNEIGYILKKHKQNYKSQVIHHPNKDDSKLNLSSKKILINLQKINQNRLISQSLKHYLSIRQNQQRLH